VARVSIYIMRAMIARLGAGLPCVLLVGCGLVQPALEALFPNQPAPGEGNQPLSAAGTAASSVQELKDIEVFQHELLEAARGRSVRPSWAEEAPIVVELTVGQDEISKLVPYLANPDEWQLVGVQMHPQGRRTFRFLSLGTDETRVDPLGRPPEERRIGLGDLSAAPPGPRKPVTLQDLMDHVSMAPHFNPLDPD